MSRCSDRTPAAQDTILRFLTTERLLHWAIAIPFLGCFSSAVVLVIFYNLDPTRPYRHVFAWMHRGCGAGLIVCPSLVLLASVRRWRIHFYNIRQAWVWTFDDIKWLALMGLAALSKRITLPDQGKFNAAEKLNFMMVMVFSPLLIITGLMIWFPETTHLGAFGPWLVHFGLATLAVPLMLGHMVMATLNPSTRIGLPGMITGFVSREWAAHHYARWFREQFPDLAHETAGEHMFDEAVTLEAKAVIEHEPLLAVNASAAAPLPYSGGARVADCEFDRSPPAAVLAAVAEDVALEIQNTDLLADEFEELVRPAHYDPRVTAAAAGGLSPAAVTADS